MNQFTVYTLPVGALQVNCYILGCTRTHLAVVVDPGDNAAQILNTLKRFGLRLERILATHAHFDHLLAARELQVATAAPFYLHPADRPLVAAMRRTCRAWLGYDPGEPPTIDGDLIPGEVVAVGDIALEVRHTPGHSPGGVTLVDHVGRRVFTGDALFAGGIGRTDFPGGSLQLLLDSIRTQILSLPDDYTVLSGHGPATTVGEERKTNPFLVGDLNVGW
ncbi:MAG: MBL fold metallo-hydrolase [Anaerolineae bacterium]